jgi:hypothetical protein
MRRIHTIITSTSIVFTSSIFFLSLIDFFTTGRFNEALQFISVAILIQVADHILCHFCNFNTWKSYYLIELILVLIFTLFFGYLYHWYDFKDFTSVARYFSIVFISYSSVSYFYYTKNKSAADDINEKLEENQNK